jgi:hypothetical protein
LKHGRAYVPPWIAPAYAGTWADYGAPYAMVGYMRTADQLVHLKGMTKAGVVGTTIFTLAAGYRPEADEIFAVISNAAVGIVIVTSAGAVVADTGNNTYFSLSGISFRAAP